MPLFIPILAAMFVALLIAGCALAYRHEKILWNHGICAEYNEPWLSFDMDSQGGRGYKCRDRVIWISWPVDRLRAVPVKARIR